LKLKNQKPFNAQVSATLLAQKEIENGLHAVSEQVN
jgi:hypothetical protein